MGMDVLKLFKSEPVKQAFIDADYKFSALEKAMIIWDANLKIKEKIELLLQLKDEYKDFILPFNPDGTTEAVSFYKYIDTKAEYADILEGYTHHKLEEIVVSDLKNHSRMAKQFTEYLEDDTGHKLIIDDSTQYLTTFDDFVPFVYEWPCPFKVGDIVTFLDISSPMVVESLDYQNMSTEDRIQCCKIGEFGRLTGISLISVEMSLLSPGQGFYGSGLEEIVWGFEDLKYYNPDNSQRYKVMLEISRYLKGEQSLGYLMEKIFDKIHFMQCLECSEKQE